MANLRLIVIDELGDECCIGEFTLPCPEELTDDEVECFEEAMLHRFRIAPEYRGYYWIRDFKTKTDREEEIAAMEQRIQELMEENDTDDEEYAYELWCEEQYDAREEYY